MYLTQLNKIDIIIIQKSKFNRLTGEGLTDLCSASKRKEKQEIYIMWWGKMLAEWLSRPVLLTQTPPAASIKLQSGTIVLLGLVGLKNWLLHSAGPRLKSTPAELWPEHVAGSQRGKYLGVGHLLHVSVCLSCRRRLHYILGSALRRFSFSGLLEAMWEKSLKMSW